MPKAFPASPSWGESQSSISAKSTTKSTDDLIHPENDYLCGVWSYRPQSLQRFAHPRWFFPTYTIMGILSGAYKTYLVGTLSTIERRFQMSNSTSAVILIADNISPIVVNVIAGYYANRISRPKLMSLGTLIVATSCLCSLLPFVIYGPGFRAEDMADLQTEAKQQLCHNNSISATPAKQCNGDTGNNSWVPFMLLLFANFLNGSGGSVYFVVGSTYMDDNIKKKNSPLYFSLSFALRLLGPVLGFMMSSLCLRYNEDIFNGAPEGLSPKDPRWIGAWWLGYIVFAIGLLIISIPMMLFPRILPMGKDQKANKIMRRNSKGATKDIFTIVRRLMKNPIFVLKTVGFLFIIIATAGYGTSFTKYLEHQFAQSPSDASFISGLTKVLTNMVGIMAGGLFIQKLKPGPRPVAAYIAVVECIYLGCIISMMFVGCPTNHINGLNPSGDIVVHNSDSLVNSCNNRCGCSVNDFKPVCSSGSQVTFYSPCYAGCSGSDTFANGTVFWGCRCSGTPSISTSLPPNDYATQGFCGAECKSLMLYLAIIVASQLIGSTARCGSMLLYLRCVAPEDKSMALGSTSSLVNLLAFIPYPLIYGRVLDSSCTLWGRTCDGQRGSCKLYDIDKLRYRIHFTTIGFLFIAVLCYIAVVFYAHRIKHFYDEPDEDSTSDKPQDNGTKKSNGVSAQNGFNQSDTTL